MTKLVYFFAIAALMSQAAFAQVSPGSDTVWKKEIWPDYARSAFFSKDDSKLYVNTVRAVMIFEPLSGSLIREVEGKGFFLFESPDGLFIFTDSLLKLDAVTYEVVGMLAPRGDNYILTDLSMSSDGSVILASYWKNFQGDSIWKQQENNIVFYNPQNMMPFDQMTIKAEVWKSEISPDKNYFSLFTFVPINNKRKVVLFDYNTKQPIDTLQQHSEPDISDIGWSPDSKYLAVMTELEVKLYKFPEMEFYAEFPHFPNDYTNVFTFAYDAASKYLITGGGYDYESKRLHVWDLETKNIKYKYPYFDLFYCSFSNFSNNGNYIVTGSGRKFLLFRTDSLHTGISEFENNINGIIYPNPASNTAVLLFNVPIPEMYDIRLYNSAGLFLQQVYLGQLETGPNTVNIDCSSLPHGVYYISVNNYEFYKLIKEN